MNRDEYLAVLETEPVTPNQRGAILGHFRRLGFHPRSDRAERLAICAALAGLDALGATAELTMGQAGQVINVLERTRDRAELAAATVAAGGAGSGDDAEQLTPAEAVGRIIILVYLAFGGDDRVRKSADVGLNIERLPGFPETSRRGGSRQS
jgi:hypothetical protein